LLHRADAPELRRAAITVIPALPGHELDNFRTLAGLFTSGNDRAAAIAGLQKMPRDTWPKEMAEPLVENLLAYLPTVPVEQRTTPDAANAFQLATDLAALLPAGRAAEINRTLRALGVSVFAIRTLKDQMLYDKTLLVLEAAKPAEIILINDDAMPHNLVVVTPGSVPEIGEAAEKMPPVADSEGRLYIPASSKILYATRLVEPGQQARLTFTAPETPDEYQYVCTFPDHWRRMVGTLAVVKDVEAYLANHASLASPKMTQWKLEDLAPDLPKVGFGRDPGAGSKLFTQLACRQCHRIGTEGNAYGPDLTEVFNRWKGDRANVLQQILEPSKVIEDRYRAVRFEMKNDDEVTGMILKEDADSLVIQTGPAETLIQTLKKSDVQSRQPQRTSVMPVGLLNSLSEDQILDLLAYLESGGNIQAHEHLH
ncbi:MAG: plastocyanin/azurin family copper-binding protein, partial [Verrucomicrobia bacterium]|nr:plastocyanin/azurin family copper-binding protein [Verrucomicrobiota bacterium]